MSYRDDARRALESIAARKTYRELLNTLKREHPTVNRFTDAEAAIATLRDRGVDASAKDALLLALVAEHQRGRGGEAFSLLAVAMFPALDRIYRTRLRRREDPDDLWGRVVGAFVEALDRYPVKRRRARVAANIEGDTMAALRRARQRDARSAKARELLLVATAPFREQIGSVDPEVPPSERVGLGDFLGSDRPRPGDPDYFTAAEDALTAYVEAGALDVEDRFVLLGAQLYGRSFAEIADELGMSVEAVKKRQHRTLVRLRALGRIEPDDPDDEDQTDC